ncbi:MAG: site-specific DNA-methyltransferase [Candidatus Abyssobacteria bacterium SURF_17]|uniref:site-specific DNA-methyltransferase (adenine-specific) n=1 Tax=Candidatus Abyssobacteria bacterium SURF_17 TaxID=2093361 RepID=A0A419EVU4_9BACT|nr:MAG: site-specific DNA-methyltransferase [Candidatus Abyssubacteria bacterium SURF_17]
MARKKKDTPTPIESVKHKDKRANIPTEELRDFVAEYEKSPKTVLYPRDPSLDPQLVWKGKDEQDAQPLEVPAVPIYIQEKIKPSAIIEDVRRVGANGSSPEPQLGLFEDFNGIKFEDLVDFYTHKDGVNWSNRMILGDSLFVMTSLAEKEGLKGKVQMIYMDPPYGIKFGSNWQVSTRKRDVKDGKVEDATRQPEQIKAFRDTWELGIHSYLAYMRDRLVVARELLTETGSIFVQIGDENVHLVRCLMDEVFGSDNCTGMIAFATTTGRGSTLLGQICDYLIWYAKDRERVKYRQMYSEKERGEPGAARYDNVELPDGTRRRLTPAEKATPSLVPAGSRFFSTDQITSAGETATGSGPVEFNGRIFQCPSGLHWKTTVDGMARLMKCNRIVAEGNLLRYVRFIDDFPVNPLNSVWLDIGGVQSRTDPKIYVVQTSATAIERCLLMTTDPGDLVLDPACGSGTTAYVAEQWGRRWITIDTSRVAIALARTRLMSAKYPYYLLADSPEGIKKEREITGLVGAQHAAPVQNDIKKGFVYKRVPHITLKSIANNPDTKEGMTREQIDAAIARHAETETLYDQPYEDSKRIRVCGPFTVESLSPHRVLAADVEQPSSEREAAKAGGPGQFEIMILENLKKAGVQNTIKNERLVFDRLEPYAGVYLHGEGEYTEGGKPRRVAVCIGPEHGTVGPELVKEAAKEAVKGIGFDLLVVCGFAFDPHVSEETKQYGKLTVLVARMNPDLAMGDQLLKKTGAGNLFMVFGEPDIVIERVKAAEDGRPRRVAPTKKEMAAEKDAEQIVVEIKGVDVYDPTTGQIRSHSTDDIACWFIDTDYNGESFFVRHAHFCGADQPYDKLKRALRAEIDESAWASLYSTRSRPFATPSKGKIAVKVINHYGDEVMKIYEV